MSTKNAPKDFIITSTGRHLFTSGRKVLEMPDLIEMQKDSYAWFLKEGLAELFDEISPITDFSFELHLFIFITNQLTI